MWKCLSCSFLEPSAAVQPARATEAGIAGAAGAGGTCALGAALGAAALGTPREEGPAFAGIVQERCNKFEFLDGTQARAFSIAANG